MSSLEQLRADRVKKLEILQKHGMQAYPAKVERSHTLSDLLYDLPDLLESNTEVKVAGRITGLRDFGKVTFIDLNDGSGEIQAVFKEDELNEDVFSIFEQVVDRGDFIAVSGSVFKTKTGQESVLVHDWSMLTKSLRPLPEEHFGFADQEERLRRRYLDILMNSDVREMVERKSKFWESVRTFLSEHSFLEVETPVLETTTGGADARAFETHHNALDLDVYLRISAGELWQKRLMVAGLPRVFEIGRIFRNEGISPEHAQDYTQMEFYWGYADYRDGMELVRELYRYIAEEVWGKQKFSIGEFEVDLSDEWKEYDFQKTILEKTGIDVFDTNLANITEYLEDNDVSYEKDGFNLLRATDALWKHCRRDIAGPGFLVGVPKSLSPLAKADPNNPLKAERFQPLLAGSELGNGYSELNNPIDQAQRFEHQQSLRESGDAEAQMYDTDYVEALEYGMPPTCGFGMSERVFSFFEDKSIRETQIFPLLRPRDGTQ